ncbi:MAG: hypothetical protein JKX85_15165 [Phycisphaeraceae bacterium]|nr:hypothetical protein [Phycisphaeraceae bacterium]
MELNEPPVSDDSQFADSGTNSTQQSPPTQQAFDLEPAKSTWPTVIGILSMVLGGFGAMGGLWQTVGPFMMGALGQLVPQDDAKAQQALAAMEQWQIPLAVIGLASLVLAVFLLVAGSKLLGRKFQCVTLYKRWAIAKMIVALPAVGIATMSQMQQMQNMVDQGQAPAAFSGMMNVVLVFMVVLGLAFAWAFPIFILFWFNRQKIHDEVGTWQG